MWIVAGKAVGCLFGEFIEARFMGCCDRLKSMDLGSKFLVFSL